MSRFRREENDWTAETGRRLREVLAQEAAAVTPSADALDRIRARTAATARRSFGRPLAMAGAALATAAVVAVAVLVAHHGGGRQPLATTPSTTPTPSAIPSSTAPMSPTPTPTVGPTYQLTLYYVGRRADPYQLLFPEVVSRPVPPEKAVIADAIRALLTTPPNDPDYTSYWPAGTELAGVTLHNSTVVVDLTMPQAPTSAPPSAVPSTPAPRRDSGPSVSSSCCTRSMAQPRRSPRWNCGSTGTTSPASGRRRSLSRSRLPSRGRFSPMSGSPRRPRVRSSRPREPVPRRSRSAARRSSLRV